MQQGAQGPQEAARILQQLFRGKEHHNDQGAFCQVLRLVGSAVQPIPATLLAVAALVTVVVFEVVCTVLVILAGFAIPLAFKVVKEALCSVAQLITLVVDVLPAAKRGGAVGPGVLHSEGTVTSIPLAGMAVAGLITDAVPSLVSAVLTQTGSRRGAGGGCVELTVAAPEWCRAAARVVRRLTLRVTGASVLAGVAGTA